MIRALAEAGLLVLADKGYVGAGVHIKTPYKGRDKPESQKMANRSHAKLRGPGERANAQLKTWKILTKPSGAAPTGPVTSPRPSTSFTTAKPAHSERPTPEHPRRVLMTTCAVPGWALQRMR